MAQKYILESQIPNLGGGGDEPKIPNNEIWYTSTDGNVVEPSDDSEFGANIVSNTYSDGKGIIKFGGDVKSIGSYAFFCCKGLTSITIPNSVTNIRDGAFGGCIQLTAITIPDSVRSIGEYAFMSCYGLTSITIPNNVTSIGDSAFKDCAGLTSIVVESDNTKYDSRNKCNAIIDTSTNVLIAGCQKTIIPNSVMSIGDLAFNGCKGLTSITVPDSVTSIGDNAFGGCSGLTSITIPSRVTSIGASAFYGCSGLTSITIGNSVTSIGAWAFGSCTGLTSITIPNSVKSIGDSAFEGCDGLTSITIGNNVTSIGRYAFYGNENLHTIIFDKLSGTHLCDILGGVFNGFPNLKTVIVGSDEDAEIIFKKIPQNNITFDIVTLVNVDENGVIVKYK